MSWLKKLRDLYNRFYNYEITRPDQLMEFYDPIRNGYVFDRHVILSCKIRIYSDPLIYANKGLTIVEGGCLYGLNDFGPYAMGFYDFDEIKKELEPELIDLKIKHPYIQEVISFSGRYGDTNTKQA